MKQSRVTGLLCAGVLVVCSTVLQAEDVNGTDAGDSVSQDAPIHSPSAGSNPDLRIHAGRRVDTLMHLGFLIGCGVIGYVLLRKANAG